MFVTQLDSASEISKLVRNLNGSNAKQLGLLKDPKTGKFFDNPGDSARDLLQKLFQEMRNLKRILLFQSDF